MKCKTYMKQISSLLSRKYFFWAIMALFILEAAWIALSGTYPMAFDEDFHLGVIRIYAHHISPFLASQPAGADSLGAVARDPSYLYQWLMSFPYRLITSVTHNFTVQVIFLRAINIAVFAWALVLYRRVLLRIDASKALANAVLAVFVLIPVTPLLAAQINYDSLFLVASAAALLLTLDIYQELATYKRLNMSRSLQLLIVCSLGCLVKFAFLPIAAACVLFLLWQIARTFRSWRKILLNIGFGLTLIERRVRWLLLIGVVLSVGLFAQRYAVNAVRYHQPLPDCDAVLSVEQCKSYGPWARDYYRSQTKPVDATRSPLVFTADWFYGMWLRLFFAVDGPATDFQTRGPLIIPGVSAIVFAVATAVAAGLKGPQLWRKYKSPVTALFAAVIVLYIASLWLQEYKAFLHTGVAVAINGRYLFPVLPIIFLYGALAWRELLGKSRLKLAVAGVAIVSLLWGGGALTYILRSNDTWYWPHSVLRGANHSLQNALGPITPGYKDPIAFMHHRY